MFGDNLVGKKCYDAFHNLNRPCTPQPCISQKVFQDGLLHKYETEVYDKNGEKRIFHCTANAALKDEKGHTIHVIEISRDITQLKKAEKSLIESELRYRSLVNQVPLVIWKTDYHGNTVFISPNIENIYGFTAEEIYRGGSSLFFERIHPDNRDEVKKAWEGLFKKTLEYNIEYKIKNKNGKWIWLHDQAKLIEEEKGSTYAIGSFTDITERKKMEEALKKSEEKYRLISENIPVSVYSALPDKDSTSLFISGRIKEITGYDSREFIDHPELFKEVIHPDDREYVWDKLKEHREQKIPLDIEFRVITRDKEIKWLRDKANPLLDQDNNVIQINGFVEDITERKEIEKKLLKSEEKYRCLIQFIQAAVVVHDRDTKIIICNPKAQELLGLTEEQILGKKTDDPVWQFLRKDGTDMPLQEYPANQVIKTGKPLRDLVTGIYHPEKDAVVWVLVNADPVKINGDKIDQVIVTFMDITDQKLAEIAVKESEKRFRELSEMMPAIILELDEKGNLVYINQYAFQVTGYSREEYDTVRVVPFRTIIPEDRKRLQENIKKILNGEDAGINEYTAIKKNGEKLHFIARSIPIRVKGEIKGIRAVIFDVTDKIMAEAALKDSESRFENLFYSFTDPIVLHDKNGVIKMINPQGAENLNLSLEECIGKSVFDILPEMKDSLKERFQNVLQTGEKYFFEDLVQLPSGPRWFWSINQPVYDLKEKETLIQVISYDITERKEMEEALKKSEKRLKSILETANEGIIEVDNDAVITAVNPELCRMYGRNREELMGIRIYDLVDPDSVETLDNQLEMRSQGKSTIYEATVLKPDQTRVRVLCNAAPLYDEKGNKTGSFAMVTDITGRKEMEDQLKSSLKEKEVLLREIYHRVKNNMQVISSLLELQAYTTKDKKVQRIIQNSQQRIKSMALVHEKLYQSKDLTHIDFNDYVTNLVDYLYQSYAMSPDNIELDIHIDKVSLDVDKAIPLGFVINELVSNALQHAFLKEQKGKIKFSLKSLEDNEIELIISDDGVGLPKNISLRNSGTLGLNLVAILIEDQLKGKIKIKRDKGTEFIIRVSGKKDFVKRNHK